MFSFCSTRTAASLCRKAAFFSTAMVLFPAGASAAGASFVEPPARLAEKISAWCITKPGTLVSHSPGEVVCDEVEVGRRAALYDLTRGSNGPRKLRTTFQIVAQGESSIVQARRSFVFRNKAGLEINTAITADADEKRIAEILTEMGGSPF